jgi:hypothetical protein
MNAFNKKTKKRLIITSITVGFFFLVSIGIYRYLTYYTPGIIQPLGEQIAFTTVQFNAEEGIEFHQHTGTHILIPKNILVDAKGNKVQGKVTLQFREFHTANEIFLSGIPMQFGNDRDAYFNSGGMMEIQVIKNGKPLNIEKGKRIDIELASAITPDADYRLFFLTDDLTWDNGRNFETINNDRRDDALAAMPAAPKAPVDPSPSEEAFIFEIASNSEAAPQLRVWNNVAWQLNRVEGDLSAEDALRVIWDQASIVKSATGNNEYEISYKFLKADYTGKMIRLQGKLFATPALEGEELAKTEAQYAQDVEKYALTVARLNAEQERLIMEAGILNKFTISQFGIYNIDKIEKLDLLAEVDVAFDFEKELNPLINHVMLYVILEDENGVIKFNAADWDKIPAISSRCSFVAVLPNGTVAYVSAQHYAKKINGSTVKKEFQNTMYFETERIPYEDFIEKILPKTDATKPRFI